MFLFIWSTDSYKFTSVHVSGPSLVLILGIVVLGAFSKDIFDYYKKSDDTVSQEIQTIISTISVFCSGVSSSFALLIPKIWRLIL